MSPDGSDKVARCMQAGEGAKSLRCTTAPMMTNSLQFDGLSKCHKRNGIKKPRTRRGFLVSTVARRDFGAAASMEMRLGRFCIFRHFGVDYLAEWVCVKGDTAVVTVFRLEAAGVAAHIGHSGLSSMPGSPFSRPYSGQTTP
jgi:hypothetical protein